MAKTDTLSMTKAAEKPYPLAPHIPIREYPIPPRETEGSRNRDSTVCGMVWTSAYLELIWRLFKVERTNRHAQKLSARRVKT